MTSETNASEDRGEAPVDGANRKLSREARTGGPTPEGQGTSGESTIGNDVEPPTHLAHLKGMDLVRRTLEEARGAARSQGKDVGRGGRGSPPRKVAGTSRRRWSGPGPDSRDPQTLASVARDVARNRGWSDRVAQGAVFGRWQAVVGEQIAAHAAPTALNEGVLTVSAESTAWATQLRMVQAQLLAKIAAAVGDGVVKSLKIVGPVGPSWRKGRYHIAGRGPRDTYG